jgi:hypothetical protein
MSQMGHEERFLPTMLSAGFSIAANVKPRPITSYRPPSWASAHTGLSLLFEVGVRPPHDGMRGWGGPIFGAPWPQISGRISRHYELTPPVVPVRTFFCEAEPLFRYFLSNGFPAFSAAASGNRRNRGAVLAPPELATIDPHPVQNYGQTPGDGDDRSTHPASLGHSHAPCLQPGPFCASSKQYMCRLVDHRAQQASPHLDTPPS